MYKIFMVEDDEIIARSIREHLQAWNYDVWLRRRFFQCSSRICPF